MEGGCPGAAIWLAKGPSRGYKAAWVSARRRQYRKPGLDVPQTSTSGSRVVLGGRGGVRPDGGSAESGDNLADLAHHTHLHVGWIGVPPVRAVSLGHGGTGKERGAVKLCEQASDLDRGNPAVVHPRGDDDAHGSVLGVGTTGACGEVPHVWPPFSLPRVWICAERASKRDAGLPRVRRAAHGPKEAATSARASVDPMGVGRRVRDAARWAGGQLVDFPADLGDGAHLVCVQVWPCGSGGVSEQRDSTRCAGYAPGVPRKADMGLADSTLGGPGVCRGVDWDCLDVGRSALARALCKVRAQMGPAAGSLTQAVSELVFTIVESYGVP